MHIDPDFKQPLSRATLHNKHTTADGPSYAATTKIPSGFSCGIATFLLDTPKGQGRIGNHLLNSHWFWSHTSPTTPKGRLDERNPCEADFGPTAPPALDGFVAFFSAVIDDFLTLINGPTA